MRKIRKKKTYTKSQMALRYTLLGLGIILCIILALFIGFLIMRMIGKNSLKNAASTDGPTLTTEDFVSEESISEAEKVNWKQGWIRYNGEVYEYNDDIRTFLIMGIDSHGVVQENKDLMSGGQADALFLVILNPDDESIKIFAINRDTMVDIIMVGIDAGDDRIVPGEIAIQHGFGDGKEQSCELTRDAVSKLLYNIPIHGYASVNFDAIPLINDRVGGVEVNVEGDWTSINKKWSDGAQVLLKGKEAYDFVHYRDTNIFASQEGRLSRQKTYLKSFINKTLAKTREDITLPVSLYSDISDYMVTDLGIDEISYLATSSLGYSFNSDDIFIMEGEVRMGQQFEEFYPDEAALKDQIIKLFYRKVEQ